MRLPFQYGEEGMLTHSKNAKARGFGATFKEYKRVKIVTVDNGKINTHARALLAL